MIYFYEDVEKMMNSLTFEEVEDHIQLYPCQLWGSDFGEQLMTECPHFYMCGFDWLFIVDLFEIDKSCPHIGMVSSEVALRWFQDPDDIMKELLDTAFLNMELKEKKLRSRTLYDESIEVPVYMYTMDGAKDYTASFMVSETFLISTHKKLGDFYVFPRYMDKFFVIAERDLKAKGKAVLDVYYSMLMHYGFTKKPVGWVFSQRMLHCDEEDLRVCM